MYSDSVLQSAMEDILDGHSHRSAYSRLQQSGVSPGDAIATVVEAGRIAPLKRHQLQANAEDYNPSGCCDYCGRRLESREFRAQKMRWQKRGGLSWKQGTLDGLGYVCQQCRNGFAPSAVESALQGLLWVAPPIAAASYLDYFAKLGGGLTAFCLFAGFVAFCVVMSRRASRGTYRAYPVPEGYWLRSASFKSDGITIGQGFVFIAAFFGFGAGCATLTSPQVNTGYTLLYLPIAATLLGGIAFLGTRRGRETESQDSMRTWCPRIVQQKPEPGHPEHATKECAKILANGGTKHDCIQSLTKSGASRSSAVAALTEVGPRIAFMRATRGDVVEGTECDLCAATFPAKVVEKVQWKWSKTTYIPLYVVTISTTESETKTGYHLWCPKCEWKATGRGANLWVVAASFGAAFSMITYALLDPLVPEGFGFLSFALFWLLFTVGAAVSAGRHRYNGYPIKQGFYPPTVWGGGLGGLLIFLATLGSLGLMGVHFSWLAHPALKTATLLASIVMGAFLYRLYARPPG